MVKISNTYLIMGQTYKFYTCIPYKKSLKTFSGTFIDASCGQIRVSEYKDSSIRMKKNEYWTIPIEWVTDVTAVSDE